MLSAPTVSGATDIATSALIRLSFHGISALFAVLIVLTWVTLTPHGANLTENFGELERIIISVSKGNNGH